MSVPRLILVGCIAAAIAASPASAQQLVSPFEAAQLGAADAARAPVGGADRFVLGLALGLFGVYIAWDSAEAPNIPAPADRIAAIAPSGELAMVEYLRGYQTALVERSRSRAVGWAVGGMVVQSAAVLATLLVLDARAEQRAGLLSRGVRVPVLRLAW